MGNFLIGLFIGALLFVGTPATQTEEVIVEKEVPVEIIVEKEVIKEVPVEVIVEKEVIKEVPVASVDINKNASYSQGTYKVGRDIPAGEYKLECSDYWGGLVSIGKDPNFSDYRNYTCERYYSTGLFIVKNGDYVKVDDGTFWLVE